MSVSSTSCNQVNSITQYAAQNPVKFVAIASLVVTGAVPVGAFFLYAVGTVLCTLIAAIVLDLTLLAFGVFGLLLALCFVGCISGGVVGLFSLVYFAYRAAVGSLNHARTRLTPQSSPPSPSPDDEESYDKNKHYHGIMPDLTTSLTSFITCLSSLSNALTYNDNHDTVTTSINVSPNTSNEPSPIDTIEERHSDLWRTSLTVVGLTSAVFIMSYTVLLTAYFVINFT